MAKPKQYRASVAKSLRIGRAQLNKRVRHCQDAFAKLPGGASSLSCAQLVWAVRIPKGFQLAAQGCEARATLGEESRDPQPRKGCSISVFAFTCGGSAVAT